MHLVDEKRNNEKKNKEKKCSHENRREDYIWLTCICASTKIEFIFQYFNKTFGIVQYFDLVVIFWTNNYN